MTMDTTYTAGNWGGANPISIHFPNPETHARRIGGDDGTVSRKDITDFQIATQRVYALMRDGQWHSGQTIIETSGIREGLRRMRELRQLNYRIERQRAGESRDWQYRLVSASTVADDGVDAAQGGEQ